MKIMVPVDGSEASLHAVRHIATAFPHEGLEVHLLNVQPPLPGAVTTFVGEAERASFHREEGEGALAESRALLDARGVRHIDHVVVGPVAETIVERAAAEGCAQIVIGSRGLSPLPNLLLGSVTTRVLHLADRPVTVVK